MNSQELFQWRTKLKPLKLATWEYHYSVLLVHEEQVMGAFAPTDHAYTLDSPEGLALEAHLKANPYTVYRVPMP